MSDIEKLFLAAYPLWPKALLQKFSSLLSFEVAKFNPKINEQIILEYKKLANPWKSIIQPHTDNVSLVLNPVNQRYIKPLYYFDFIRVYTAKLVPGRSFEIVQDDPSISYLAKYYGKVNYDIRIYESPQVTIDKSIVYHDQYGYISSYFGSSMVEYCTETVYSVFSGILKNYDGAKTVIAMIENRISIDVDQDLLREFVTILNAYDKYSGELAAANSLQAEKNRQTMTDYKNSISEKLNNRKNELSDLRTQISFAAKNETASAKRDMQSLTLSAQSLMVQLQDKLK